MSCIVSHAGTKSIVGFAQGRVNFMYKN